MTAVEVMNCPALDEAAALGENTYPSASGLPGLAALRRIIATAAAAAARTIIRTSSMSFPVLRLR